MTNQKLFNALEISLQALDHGADLESCLALFPAQAEELRPLLIAALEARSGQVADVPVDALRRGRAKVLQAAAEMREQSAARALPPFRRWQNNLPGSRFFRLVVTTAVTMTFLLSGGTGLVSASSSALPGDHLYPVKRSWEGVRLFFVANPGDRLQLEQKFEQERYQEIEELYSEKRVARVNFQGQLQTRSNGNWVVGGLDVSLNGNATPEAGIVPGVTVQVIGETDNGMIKAEQILLVITPTPAGDASPAAAPSSTPSPSGTPTAIPTGVEDTPTPTRGSEQSVFNPTGTRRPSDRSSESGGNTQYGNATASPPGNGEDNQGGHPTESGSGNGEATQSARPTASGSESVGSTQEGQ